MNYATMCLLQGCSFLVETDLQSAIGGLLEEGRSNAGVCVLARGVRKRPAVAQLSTLQLISQIKQKLKVTVHV